MFTHTQSDFLITVQISFEGLGIIKILPIFNIWLHKVRTYVKITLAEQSNKRDGPPPPEVERRVYLAWNDARPRERSWHSLHSQAHARSVHTLRNFCISVFTCPHRFNLNFLTPWVLRNGENVLFKAMKTYKMARDCTEQKVFFDFQIWQRQPFRSLRQKRVPWCAFVYIVYIRM